MPNSGAACAGVIKRMVARPARRVTSCDCVCKTCAPNNSPYTFAASCGCAEEITNPVISATPFGWFCHSLRHTSSGVRCWQKKLRPFGTRLAASGTVRKRAFGEVPSFSSTGRKNSAGAEPAMFCCCRWSYTADASCVFHTRPDRPSGACHRSVRVWALPGS
ncbi:hypothetical protein D3C73_1253740 [compost metagenome]